MSVPCWNCNRFHRFARFIAFGQASGRVSAHADEEFHIFIAIQIHKCIFRICLPQRRTPVKHLVIKYSTLNFDCVSESRVKWIFEIKKSNPSRGMHTIFVEPLAVNELLVYVRSCSSKNHCKEINLLAFGQCICSRFYFIFIYFPILVDHRTCFSLLFRAYL